jgi:dynein heavy chain
MLAGNLGDYKSNINTKDGKKDLKDVKQLTKIMENTRNVKAEEDSITLQIDQLDETIKALQAQKLVKDNQVKQFTKIGKDWTELKKITKEVAKQIEPFVAHEKERNKQNIKKLEESITQFTQDMKKREFYQYGCGPNQAKEKLDAVFEELATFENQITDFGENADKFGEPDLIIKANKDIESIKVSINVMKQLWDHIAKCHNQFETFQQALWKEIVIDDMLEIVNKLAKALKEIKVDKRANAAIGIQDDIKMWINFLGVIEELASDKMRDRHWDKLKEKLGVQFEINDSLKLQFIFELKLGNYQEDVEEITDQAANEAKMEDLIARLETDWKPIKFVFQAHKDSGYYLIKLGEDEFEALENDQTLVSSMFSNRYLATFEEEINYWNKALANISEIVTVVGEVQRTWSFLENLFIHSDEVKKELPKESQKFIEIDKNVKEILADGYKTQLALDFCVKDWVLPQLEKIQVELTVCETALNAFMFSKQVAFPRFFFVSPTDLLDILSNGNSPAKIMKHMPKIITAIKTLHLKEEGVRPFGEGWVSDIGKEEVNFTRELKLLGKVECYLQDIIDCMRNSLKDISLGALKSFTTLSKD